MNTDGHRKVIDLSFSNPVFIRVNLWLIFVDSRVAPPHIRRRSEMISAERRRRHN